MDREFKPSVRVTGEGVEYSASSLGSCIRALAAARQELEPYTGPLPENIASTFQRGHDAEEYGKKWFQDRGWIVANEQMEVILQLTGRIKVVGHIDFTIQKGTFLPTIIDSKRQNDEEFARNSITDSWLWEKYAWQFSSYMHTSPDVDFTVQRISDAGDVKLERIEEPPHSRFDILRRILDVEATAALDLREVSCTHDDFPCPYFRLLHEKEEEEFVEVESEELANLALHYKRLGVEIEPLTKRRGEIRKELIKVAGEGRTRETGTGIEVRVTTYATKEKVVPAGSSTRVTVDLPDAPRADQ